MTAGADPHRGGLADAALAELVPFPGRLATAWRVALVTSVVAATAMLYQTPNAAISCYLATFLMKPDSTGSSVLAVVMAILITLVIAFVTFLSIWTISSPPLRLVVMAGVLFGLLFLGSASKLGPIGGMVGVIVADVLTLLNKAPGGEIVSAALRFSWEMAVMPMAMVVAFSLVIGRSTVTLAREALVHRLTVAREALAEPTGPAQDELQEMLRAGNTEVGGHARFIATFHLAPAAAARQIIRDVSASWSLLFAVGALPPVLPAARLAELAKEVGATLAELDSGRTPRPPAPSPADATPAETSLRAALGVIAGAEPPPAPPPEKKAGFFLPDAFTDPRHQRHALKTAGAAMLCYILYASLNWQGIHTAMITCLVASLGTTGETLHKLTLRISGCLMGAAMGYFALIVVFPHIDQVGQLMALVFAGTLVAAWVAAGGERISYAGIQIGLAFFLSIFDGFGPGVDLSTARDRIIGVLVGNCAVYLIATQLWPVSLERRVRQALAQALGTLSRLAALSPEGRAAAEGAATEVAAIAGRITDALMLLPFEPDAVRPRPETEERLARLRDALEVANAEIRFAPNDLPGTSEALAALAAWTPATLPDEGNPRLRAAMSRLSRLIEDEK